MSGRIHVRARLPDMREYFREKSRPHGVRRFLVPIDGLSRFLRKSRPARNPGANAWVRSTNFLLASVFWIGQSEGVPWRPAGQNRTEKHESRRTRIANTECFHCSGVNGSQQSKDQQLSTTPNNPRRFAESNALFRIAGRSIHSLVFPSSEPGENASYSELLARMMMKKVCALQKKSIQSGETNNFLKCSKILDPNSRSAVPPDLCALGIMTKAPQPGKVKTRLSPPLTPDEAAELNIVFFATWRDRS